MYQALYRKYRPKTFDEIIGQEVIVKTLKNSIKNNMVSHAYLLAGPRGTGKTSVAKIFAKILNCHNLNELEPCNECVSCIQANNNQNIDIIEIDAASNNGVDEIREIRNKITLVPTNSKYKIYIIDEVHMLTNQAFNALLKTLEEPPQHVIFIFATTEPQKIPKTILSRCQRFDYKKVGVEKIVNRLKYISEKENIKITNEALLEIAKVSDGGVRDSISLLDQALAYSENEINVDDIHEINGTLTLDEIYDLILNILNQELVDIIKKIEKYDNEGKSIVKITQEIIDVLKDCLLYVNAPELVTTDKEFYERVKKLRNTSLIYNYIKKLSSLLQEMKNVSNSRLLLEIELIKNTKVNNDDFINTDENNSNKNLKEEKKEKVSTKDEENIEISNDVNYDKNKFEILKKERIKNSLCKFSQKEREKMKKKIEKISENITDEENGNIISLILDGEIKSVSDNYLMFMYNSKLMEETFNFNLEKIEMVIDKYLNEKYNVIGINLDDWNFIKNDYNKNKSQYNYSTETYTLKDVFEIKKNKKNIKTNSIDEMFNDIIEYE